jgi:hypothetical protein
MRVEFRAGRAVFTNLKTAQQAVDEWKVSFNTPPTEGVPAERMESDWVSGKVTTRSVNNQPKLDRGTPHVRIHRKQQHGVATQVQ